LLLPTFLPGVLFREDRRSVRAGGGLVASLSGTAQGVAKGGMLLLAPELLVGKGLNDLPNVAPNAGHCLAAPLCPLPSGWGTVKLNPPGTGCEKVNAAAPVACVAGCEKVK